MQKREKLLIILEKSTSKEIKLIKNKYDSNIIDFTGESSRIVNFPINKFKKVINEVLDRDGAEA